jgi:hypothetical protein
MIQRAILGFLANATWQIPLLAVGAAILVRAARLSPARQCGIWAISLVLALLLPANLPSVLPLDRRERAVQLEEPAPQRAVPVTARPQGELRGDPVRGADGRGLVLERGFANLLTAIYLLAIGLGIGRLLLKLARARRLMRGSRSIALPAPIETAVRCFAASHEMAAPPIRMSGRVSGPATVGIGEPTILVPEDFLQYEEVQAITALLHECAHVARRDYCFSILYEFLALPLIWHPAIHVIRAGISDSREMACDLLAAEQMNDRLGYARSLIALAERIVGDKPALGGALPLLGRAGLAKRVEAVIRAGGPRRPAFVRNALAFAILLPATLAPAALLHVMPMIATIPSPPPPSPWGPGSPPLPQVTAADAPAGQEHRSPAGAVRAAVATTFAPASPPPLGLSRMQPRVANGRTAAGPAPLQAETAMLFADAAGRGGGRQPYSDEERAQLHYNGIDADEIAAFAGAGYARLTVDDLINLHYRGISGRFVAQLSAAGFPPFSPAELIALSDQGISAREIASLGPVGHSTFTVADIIRIRYLGITPGFVARLRDLGYENLSADTLIRSFQTGIDPPRPRRRLSSV